jgi:hypothetical protein
MREHRYSFEIPHSTARVWAPSPDYDRWTDHAPMVKRVDGLHPGDEHHDGRLRRVVSTMPFGREGSALELVTDVEPERGSTFTKAPWKWFEDPICRSISRNNEDSMRRAAQWLTDHPEYRSDLVDTTV